jgi:hypothetical protein
LTWIEHDWPGASQIPQQLLPPVQKTLESPLIS